MFLQRLKEYAGRQDDLPPAYYRERPPEFLIELDSRGELLNPAPIDLRGEGSSTTDNLSKVRNMPYIVRRGTHYKPFLLCDQADYTFGWPPSEEDLERTERRHKLYLHMLRECVEQTEVMSVKAVLHFLENAPLRQLEWPENHNERDRFTFRIDGNVWPTKNPAVQEFWADTQVSDNAPLMQCIICGRHKPVLKRLKNMIKGIPGTSSGYAQIISANKAAYESYGLEKSLIAPICASCAESMTSGLGKLLDTRDNHLRVGNGVFVFWTRNEREGIDIRNLLSDPDPRDVRVLLESVWNHQNYLELSDAAFYAAYLTAIQSRVQVRDWLDTTVAQVQHSLARWFSAQRIVGNWGEPPEEAGPLGIHSLAGATVRDMNDLPPNMLRDLVRSALTGQPLPAGILQQVVRRTRAEQTVWRPHAALVKLVLQSQRAIEASLKEDPMSDLDLTNREPAYLCGRLLAEIEAAQRAAIPGAKATVVDRFYGAASTAPASVFGNLLRNTQSHLGKLKRDRPGAYAGIQQRLEQIMASLPGFPRTLSLNEQALFVLGYYHQRASDRAAVTAAREGRSE